MSRFSILRSILPLFMILFVAGCSSDSNPTGPLPDPIADFTMSGETDSPATIYFTNRSTEADRYSWDFGGGATSTQEHPQVIFADYGTFTITLIATRTATGRSDSFQRQLTITPGRVYLESVTIIQIPFSDANGVGWDNNGTGPDLQWDLTDSNDDILLSSRTVSNVHPSDLPIPYTINPDYELGDLYNTNVYDDDTPAGFELMGGFPVTIWAWAESNNYNESWIIDTHPDVPSRNVQVRLTVRWE